MLNEGTKVGFQRFHQAMAQYFSEVEIAEIAAVINKMNVWTCLKLAQGETPYFE